MAHTPGPWYVEYFCMGAFQVSRMPDEMVICGRNEYQEFTEEFRCNAHLIAAAPELLEVVSEVAKWPIPSESSSDGVELPSGFSSIVHVPFKTIRNARKAIAKAKGQGS